MHPFRHYRKIRETLNNLILKVRVLSHAMSNLVHFQRPLAHDHAPRLSHSQSPQDWQTGVGLPFVRIEGTVRLLV